MKNFFKVTGSTRPAGAAPALLLGALICASSSALAAPVTAKKADAFVDTIGVNIHLGYDGGVYSDFTNVKARLQEMGIRHTRDGFENSSFKQYIKDRHNDLGRSGIKGTFLSGGGLTPAQVLQSADLMKDAVEAIEGQNEILNIYVGWDDAKRNAARQYQIDLFNTVNASSYWNSTPILGPTAVGYNAYVALGDLSAYMDYGNAHAYPLGPAPAVPESGYFKELDGARIVAPGKQLFVTETGYTSGTSDSGNQRVSPAAAGKYAPRLYLENFNRGILRSFWYELVDQGTSGDQEATFGLVNSSFAYKPQGTAIKNLTTLLKDATFNSTTRQWVQNGSFTPGSLDYTLTGTTANVHSTLLQKANGKFYLCLWQEVNSYNIADNVEANINNADVSVTLTLNTPIASAVSYRPTNSTTSSALTISNNTISLSVPDQVLIVELTPGGTTPTPTPTPSTVRYEGENLTELAMSSGDTVGDFTETGTGLSNNAATLFNANAANDFVIYQVNVPLASTYAVYVGVKKKSNRGIFQLATADSLSGTYTNRGATQDNYNTASTVNRLSLGNVAFGSSGNKAFRFTVTGKNSSSTGFGICIDYIELVPVASGVPIGQRIAFKANVNGKFVMADLGVSDVTLKATASVADTWEKFDVVDAGNGSIALRAYNGKYVTCDMSTGANRTLKAPGATTIGTWERFTWTDLGNNNFALKSDISGFYVSSDQSIGATLVAPYATTVGTWERFTWQASP